MKLEELTGKIIRAFYNVYNRLGFGFLEKVYERAFIIELNELGISASTQKKIQVYYKGELVGFYKADLVVENLVLCELKAAETICDADETQLINYLKSTEFEVGLVLNFRRKPQIKRQFYNNELKRHPPKTNS